MFVFALIAAVWTCPKPAILSILNRFYEVFADFVGGGFGIPMLAHDDLP